VFFTLLKIALNGYFLTALLTAEGALPLLGFTAMAMWLISMIDGIRRLGRKSA
jgi:hypothetical protein